MAASPPLETPPDASKSTDTTQLSQSSGFAELADRPPLDTWELDEHLRHVARLLGLNRAGIAQTHARLDPAQAGASGWHRRRDRRLAARKRSRPRRKLRVGQFVLAAVTWLGVATLTCGACLLGWSEFASRDELQSVGLVIAIGGILLLAIGMTLGLGEAESPSSSQPVHHRIDSKSSASHRRPHLGRSASQRSGKAA